MIKFLKNNRIINILLFSLLSIFISIIILNYIYFGFCGNSLNKNGFSILKANFSTSLKVKKGISVNKLIAIKLKSSIILYAFSFILTFFISYILFKLILYIKNNAIIRSSKFIINFLTIIHPIILALLLIDLIAYNFNSFRLVSFNKNGILYFKTFLLPSLSIAIPLSILFISKNFNIHNLSFKNCFFHFWFDNFAYFITSAIIIEKIFCIQGIFKLFIDSCYNKDTNVSAAIIFYLIILCNLFDFIVSIIKKNNITIKNINIHNYLKIFITSIFIIFFVYITKIESKPVTSTCSIERLISPNFEYFLGTDELGRDILGIIKGPLSKELFSIFILVAFAIFLSIIFNFLMKKISEKFISFIRFIIKPFILLPPIIFFMLYFSLVRSPNIIQLKILVFLIAFFISLDKLSEKIFFNELNNIFILFYYSLCCLFFLGFALANYDISIGNMLYISFNNLDSSGYIFYSLVSFIVIYLSLFLFIFNNLTRILQKKINL